jgi:hypothetical protein
MPLESPTNGEGLGWGCGIQKLRNARFDPFLSISFAYTETRFALAVLLYRAFWAKLVNKLALCGCSQPEKKVKKK